MKEINKKTVLLAEDDMFVLNIISRMLTSSGFRVLQARDGLEAYEIFLKHSRDIDLFVFDVVMPRMGGVQAYKAIYLETEGKLTQKVLYLTAYGDDILKSNKQNEFEYLLKPIDKTIFLNKIKEILNSQKRN